MSSSFTDGTTAVQPRVLDGWQSTRAVRTVVQDVQGGGVDAWLQPASPRSGTLTAMFVGMSDAFSLEALLGAGTVLTFADSDEPARGMTFVASGDIRVTRGDDALLLPDGTEEFGWAVEFGFQEVTAS